ncbi:MAG: hypothetical protein CVV27_09855 [Candidatus Melainabacteria bacterium HGW-Melainabacteria-1]|nr:MAG: hypothetical protein CVV27_09855 [Candidatus Melainabacteria bacterium HGW-Melainabacteria-1]
MTDQSLVSVLVPLYNHRAYVGQALDSLLAQDHQALEIVVVDDGSDDGGPELIEAEYARHGVRLIRQRRNGCGTTRALNTGLAHCRGDYVCWLSADDLFLPHKISTQLAAYRERFPHGDGVLHARPGYLSEDLNYARQHARLPADEVERHFAAGGAVSWVDPAENPSPGTELFYFFLFNFVNGITVFLPRALFGRQGAFAESFPLTQDYEYWFRLAWRGVPFHVLPEQLSVSRMHQGNLGRYRTDIPAEKQLIPRLYAQLVDADAMAQARQIQGFGPDQHALLLARIMQVLQIPDQELWWLQAQRKLGLPPEWHQAHDQLEARYGHVPVRPATGKTFSFVMLMTQDSLSSWRWYMVLSHYFQAFGAQDPVQMLIWLPSDQPPGLADEIRARLEPLSAYLQAPLAAPLEFLDGGEAAEALALARVLLPVGSPDARESWLIYHAQLSGRPVLYHAGPAQFRVCLAEQALLAPLTAPAWMVPQGPGLLIKAEPSQRLYQFGVRRLLISAQNASIQGADQALIYLSTPTQLADLDPAPTYAAWTPLSLQLLRQAGLKAITLPPLFGPVAEINDPLPEGLNLFVFCDRDDQCGWRDVLAWAMTSGRDCLAPARVVLVLLDHIPELFAAELEDWLELQGLEPDQGPDLYLIDGLASLGPSLAGQIHGGVILPFRRPLGLDALFWLLEQSTLPILAHAWAESRPIHMQDLQSWEQVSEQLLQNPRADLNQGLADLAASFSSFWQNSVQCLMADLDTLDDLADSTSGGFPELAQDEEAWYQNALDKWLTEACD